MAEPLDLEVLKRRGVVMGNTPSVHYTEDEHRAVVAALERIPAELERDLEDAKAAFRACRQGNLELQADVAAALRRAERLEAAARPVAYPSTGICANCVLQRGRHAPGCPVLVLRAALAPAPEGSEKDRYGEKPTAEQLAKQTDFCRSMHFYCAADGLNRCPVCDVRIHMYPAPGEEGGERG